MIESEQEPTSALSHEDATHIALHAERDEIVIDAVRTLRRRVGTDATFAALRDDDQAYSMRIVDGIEGEAFRRIRVRPGLGLGGQVLDLEAPRTVTDYPNEEGISSDYRDAVGEERLRGMGCVPIFGPAGAEVLLYVGMRACEQPGERMMQELQRVADYASIGLRHAAARAREKEIAILRDRQQLATDLHDSIAQSLFAIGVEAELSSEGRDPSHQLERIAEIARSARGELRQVLATLARPPAEVRFESALESELHAFESYTGCNVWTTREGAPRELPQAHEQLLLGCLREGLRNAAKHATQDIVLAHVCYRDTSIALDLLSEGDGEATTGEPEPGSGIALLAQRAMLVGGVVRLERLPHGAVKLRVELPL